MKKEEIHLIQRDTVHQTTIIIDFEIEATVTIKKSAITDIIHDAKNNT